MPRRNSPSPPSDPSRSPTPFDDAGGAASHRPPRNAGIPEEMAVTLGNMTQPRGRPRAVRQGTMRPPEPGWQWRPQVFMADGSAAAPKAAKRVFERPDDAEKCEHCQP